MSIGVNKYINWASLVLSGKEPACQRRRHVLNPWVGTTPWSGKWQPFPYSCLGNPMDRGAWRATVHEVTKSWTRRGN